MSDNNTRLTDVLIIGAGIAGVRAAVAASRLGARVTVVSKGPCCTGGVIGFNAPVGRGDSEQLYYDDLIKSGCSLNDPVLARTLAEKSKDEVSFLVELGLRFDRLPDGSCHLIQPLGCTVPRLVHTGSRTGAAAERLLVEDCLQRGVEFVPDIMIFDLVRAQGEIRGAAGVNLKTGELSAWIAGAVVLAAGGCGDIYPVTTYPPGISGDGYAMAFRAGAELVDMEFLQFEPCCFTYPEKFRGMGLSTTMLMEGARLKNRLGDDFVAQTFTSGTAIQKGELSRAIWSQIAQGKGTEHGGVYYDLTRLPEKTVRDHCFFFDALMKSGVNLKDQPAEVAPAAHTCLGGVRVDRLCKSSAEGLYAAGEAVGGLHGANRIGGCAGAEVFVFGAIAGQSAANRALADAHDPAKAQLAGRRLMEIYKRRIGRAPVPAIDYMSEIRGIVSEKIGLIRNEQALTQAIDELQALAQTLCASLAPDMKRLAGLVAAENMVETALLCAKASLSRRESLGVFFREDVPPGGNTGNGESFVLEKTRNGAEISVVRRKAAEF